jgi:hypothetical protein
VSTPILSNQSILNRLIAWFPVLVNYFESGSTRNNSLSKQIRRAQGFGHFGHTQIKSLIPLTRKEENIYWWPSYK